jgi:hypothetical protein
MAAVPPVLPPSSQDALTRLELAASEQLSRAEELLRGDGRDDGAVAAAEDAVQCIAAAREHIRVLADGLSAEPRDELQKALFMRHQAELARLRHVVRQVSGALWRSSQVKQSHVAAVTQLGLV